MTDEAERPGRIAQRAEGERHGEAERERLRRTFDGVARSYQTARPEYPAALYDDLLAVTGLPPGDRILEIGCGTGKNLVELAQWFPDAEIIGLDLSP